MKRNNGWAAQMQAALDAMIAADRASAMGDEQTARALRVSAFDQTSAAARDAESTETESVADLHRIIDETARPATIQRDGQTFSRHRQVRNADRDGRGCGRIRKRNRRAGLGNCRRGGLPGLSLSGTDRTLRTPDQPLTEATQRSTPP